MLSVLDIVQKTTAHFAARGIENPRLNAELLIGHALGLKRMQLYLQFERLLPEGELEKIRPLVRRRSQREPLQYVIGEVEFAGLKLKVDRRALIPRPETELLVEMIGQRMDAAAVRSILDLGTGTGALALALAAVFPQAQVLGVDVSDEALGLAAENVQRLGMAERVTVRRSDWYSAVEPGRRFEIIVANPPYLTEEEVREAAPEVREFEPAGALVAPEEGRAALNQIITRAPEFLASRGLLALETGIAQHAALSSACVAAGLTDVESVQDLTGRDRFVLARASS